MARADDDDALRRRSRPRARPPPPTSIASMYAQSESPASAPNPSASASRAPRSSKMKMASLMAGVDDDSEAQSEAQSRSKRVKVDPHDAEPWAPISISSLTADAPPPTPTPIPPPPPTQTPASLFRDELPPVIQSFSQERRQAAANGDSGNKNGANGDASPLAARSLLDWFFPAGRAEPSGGRSLKRKRRSARRADELAAAEVDLLRFGVDAAKLVPQGLVDRVDVHMSRAVLLQVVGNHVANWCGRAGFAPAFRQEITTLLAAYYPCSYPTLLDEVLAGFLFKRPEFMDLLLPPMLEKMSKAGESVSSAKYPVADALVRMCATSAGRAGPQAAARHDLACRSLLRCLVENNGDRFVLSPWIVACASESSDSVRRTLWRALLPRYSMAEPDEDDLDWRIQDPGQQIVELMAEEGKLRACRMTCGFVELLLSDDDMKKQLVDAQSYLVPECLERAFKYASTDWSSTLMAEWLERRRKQPSEGGSFKDLVDFLVRFNSKLSVKKPEWFVKHVLSFVLSPQSQVEEQGSVLRAILRDHMPFVFGGVDDQPLEQQSRQNGSADPSVSDTSGRTGGLDAAGSQALLEARSKMELLIRLLVAANARTSALFVDIWSEAWSDKRTTVSWNHVHALISVAIKDSIEEQSEFGQMLQSLATRICRAYYYRLSRYVGQDNTHDDVAVKFSEALNLLLSSTHPAANVLLQEVLSALADFEQEHPADACTIFGNAVTQQLGKCGGGGMETSVKRGVVQKPLVEYDRSPLDAAVDVTSFKSSVTSIHLLTILTSLAGTKNSTGDFTRRVLSTGPLVRLLTGLINIGRRRRRQEMLLDVMNVVVISNTSAKLNREWARQYVVQELVYCAYTSPPSSARNAIALLQNIFRHSTNGVRALLWVVLQQCTKLCCGREEMSNSDASFPTLGNYQGRADSFAELVKAMVITVSASTVREVLSFVEQKLFSCSVGKTRTNLFLLLLLRKLVVCEFQCSVLLPVVQLAVCPLAPSDFDHLRLVQLQLVKALCSRLEAIRHRPAVFKYADRKRCEDLVCNERLQSDLRSMVKVARTSRASEVLAQGILAFTHQLKQQGLIDEEDGARRELKKIRMK